jgi:hypothetical protein
MTVKRTARMSGCVVLAGLICCWAVSSGCITYVAKLGANRYRASLQEVSDAAQRALENFPCTAGSIKRSEDGRDICGTLKDGLLVEIKIRPLEDGFTEVRIWRNLKPRKRYSEKNVRERLFRMISDELGYAI